jgi:TP901 family phage tail tape measure protein
LSGFGLKAEEMGRVGDVLTATFTRTNVDLGMLGYSMKYAAPIARQLGVSLEDAAAMSGLLGNVGIQGSQAGTSMRGIFNRLAAQKKPVREALDDLGIKASDSEDNLRPVIEILGDVAKATEGMGNAKQLKYFTDIAGVEAGTAFAELVKQGGAEAITQFVKILEGSHGEAKKVAQTMSDNLDGDMTGLSSAYQDAQISMGDLFLPVLREVVQWMTKLTRSIGQWIQANPTLVKVLTTVALVIGSVIAAMGGLALVMVAVLGPIAMLRYALIRLNGTSTGAMIKRLGQSLMVLARNKIPKAITAIRTLNLAMLANPMGLMVIALAAGAALIIYHWSKIKRFFDGFWKGLDLSKQFIDPFSRLIPSITQGFADAFAPLQAAFEPLRPLLIEL